MQEVNINTLIDKYNNLKENIPNDIILVGKIDHLRIKYKYNQLDLSRIKCIKIYYKNQKWKSIKNHMLPNSLIRLDCSFNELTSLPYLPNSLMELYCSNNQLTLLLNLPNSLEKLDCSNNQLKLIPNLPNSLTKLFCTNNQLTSLPDLPNSLRQLYCQINKLTSLPDLPENLKIKINQYIELDYLPYYKNIKFLFYSWIRIKGYNDKSIKSQEDWDEYMNYKLNQMNRIKSARK